MAGFCLPKFTADAMREKLVSGELTPEKLAQMNSAERRTAFSFLGEENARQVNALFESKLLLKDQQAGMIRWAKQILGPDSPALRDTLAKVERNIDILSEEDLDVYLEDLVNKKMGIDITQEESAKLVELSQGVERAKANLDPDSPIGSESRVEYGLQLALFKEYVEGLKLKNNSTFMRQYIEEPSKLLYDLAGASKSILASLDNSFFGRQGLKVLTTNPDIWAKSFLKSWGDFGKAIAGGDATQAVKADIYSRPNALNGNYQRAKVALGLTTEEAFPSSLPTRIPVLGRLFKGSEQAYNSAALRMRADLMDRFLKMAEENGVDITDKKQAESIGKLVNSMTGRGSIGKAEALGKEINLALFSVKFLKSNFDYLTAHTFDREMSSFARKQAAANLVKTIGSLAGVLYIANQLWPGSVETDPRSADFGKIRIGDTRFDISGGMGSLVTLAVRLATGETKSSTTGKVTDLTSDKYGAPNRFDVLLDFGAGKTSPPLKAVIDVMRNKDFTGQRPTLRSTAENMVTPLPVTTWEELQSPKAAPAVLSFILSELGVGVNTYNSRKP